MFEKTGINFRLIFYGVFLFIIVVGPLNFILCRYYFANVMTIVITTPLFSVLVSLLFVTVDFFGQGISTTTIRQSFTILDQQNNRSISIGRTGFYSPMTAGKIVFDLDTEVLPYFRDLERGIGKSNGEAAIAFGQNSQVLLNGWIETRKLEYFNLRKASRCDLKITFQENGGGEKEIINGLGVDLVKFAYRDDAGNLFTAQNVAAGDTVTLERSSAPTGLSPTGHSIPGSIRRMSPSNAGDRFQGNWDPLLARGHYIAEMESSPFLDPPQAGVIEKPAPSFVYGIPEKLP